MSNEALSCVIPLLTTFVVVMAIAAIKGRGKP